VLLGVGALVALVAGALVHGRRTAGLLGSAVGVTPGRSGSGAGRRGRGQQRGADLGRSGSGAVIGSGGSAREWSEVGSRMGATRADGVGADSREESRVERDGQTHADGGREWRLLLSGAEGVAGGRTVEVWTPTLLS
jgi:hypothetical protein